MCEPFNDCLAVRIPFIVQCSRVKFYTYLLDLQTSFGSKFSKCDFDEISYKRAIPILQLVKCIETRSDVFFRRPNVSILIGPHFCFTCYFAFVLTNSSIIFQTLRSSWLTHCYHEISLQTADLCRYYLYRNGFQ